MTKDEEILALHRELAQERLRADLGWERYESANADRNSLRASMAEKASHVFLGYASTTAVSTLKGGDTCSASIQKEPYGEWKVPVYAASYDVQVFTGSSDKPKTKKVKLDLNGNVITTPKCIHCKKERGHHKAKTLNCPIGLYHRTMGYTSYGDTVFTPKEKS